MLGHTPPAAVPNTLTTMVTAPVYDSKLIHGPKPEEASQTRKKVCTALSVSLVG